MKEETKALDADSEKTDKGKDEQCLTDGRTPEKEETRNRILWDHSQDVSPNLMGCLKGLTGAKN